MCFLDDFHWKRFLSPILHPAIVIVKYKNSMLGHKIFLYYFFNKIIMSYFIKKFHLNLKHTFL